MAAFAPDAASPADAMAAGLLSPIPLADIVLWEAMDCAGRETERRRRFSAGGVNDASQGVQHTKERHGTMTVRNRSGLQTRRPDIKARRWICPDGRRAERFKAYEHISGGKGKGLYQEGA